MIRFHKDRPPLQVPHGANLMQELLKAGVPVASSCYGDGVCGKCRLQIAQGKENLSAPNVTEDILRERLRLDRDVRISCQTQVLGDITIDASYW